MVGPKSEQRWQRIAPQTRASSLPPGRVAAVLPTRRGWQRAGTGLNIGELKDMNIKRLTQVAIALSNNVRNSPLRHRLGACPPRGLTREALTCVIYLGFLPRS